jgi:beta-xylosidase
MNSNGNVTEELPVLPDYTFPWLPDAGDGTYRNPVLYADYSDPDAIRHGADFWLVASSFNCTPGLPILHSQDLVNWSLVNHALKQVPGERYRAVQPGCGVWAPAMRFHAGRFWIFFAMPDEGIYLTTAADPRGEWSEPRLVQPGRGLIDPCPFWEDDGQAYLVHAYAHSRSGLKHQLRVCPLAADGSRLLGEGKIVFHEPNQQHTIEGPKFVKRNGWYYILAPAGGVTEGWQTVLRSRHIFGPYEARIVLQQGRTPVNGPHQGALVDTAAGEWWFLHFQDAGVYGRLVHLQPVIWHDDWPLMGDLSGNGTIGEPVLRHAKPKLPTVRPGSPATSDEFSSSKLGRQWQWYANYHPDWSSLAARDGWLRLQAQPANPELSLTPHLLLQKFPARAFAVETLLEFAPQAVGDEAGLVIAGQESAALALRRTESGLHLIFRTQQGGEEIASWSGGGIRLRVQVEAGGRCVFGLAGEENRGGGERRAFQASAGKWIGAKVGLYCSSQLAGTGAYADFDYFRFAGDAGWR